MPDEVPDICGFLDSKKETCDKDPDTNPFDDVRHYAYEGEGNSDGSLSSLASCELNFQISHIILLKARKTLEPKGYDEIINIPLNSNSRENKK